MWGAYSKLKEHRILGKEFSGSFWLRRIRSQPNERWKTQETVEEQFEFQKVFEFQMSKVGLSEVFRELDAETLLVIVVEENSSLWEEPRKVQNCHGSSKRAYLGKITAKKVLKNGLY